MKLKGTDFAKAHMETKGWTSGEGLGRHSQGITDAIKPKLKFDQCGMGHNRADEFEFHWWDHVFNKAAKSVTVDDSKGEVKVDFNSDKSELSTKKIRKKAQKEMKQKLYSNFVKSGTMTGGKFEEEDTKEIGNFVEDKDLSKIRTLTDEELVKACGGRTAHKGSRHGHKMNAKLLRIEQAEKEFMEKFAPKTKEAGSEATGDADNKQDSVNQTVDLSNGRTADSLFTNEEDNALKKKKKKLKNKDLEAAEEAVEQSNKSAIEEFPVETLEFCVQQKKKKRKRKDLEVEEKIISVNEVENTINTPTEFVKISKKKKKRKNRDFENEGVVLKEDINSSIIEMSTKKKLKKSVEDSTAEILESNNYEPIEKKVKKKKKKAKDCDL